MQKPLAMPLLLAMLACSLTFSAGAAESAEIEASETPRIGARGREGSGPDSLADGPQILDEKGQRLKVTPLKGLERPWALAFLPDGAMLVTERPGRLRRVNADFTLDPKPIAGVPDVLPLAYKGLMDVALHPDYAENRWVYFTYNKRLPGETDENWDELTGPAATAVLARGRYDGAHRLEEVRDLFVSSAATSGVSAARIAFGPDGKIYMSIGAPSYLVSEGGTNRIGSAHEAQDPASHAGKILRLNDDGTVPSDNPFVDEPGYLPEIFALGIRNPMGIIAHPVTGAIWSVEHGPLGGDEINIIEAGNNYGWPLISYGRAYTGDRTGAGSGPVLASPVAEGMTEPWLFWSPNIAPGGLVIYTGDLFPDWRGHAFVGGLGSTQLQRIEVTEDGLPREQYSLLVELGQRIREVREGPDGRFYLLTDHDHGAIIRVEPAAE
ncbi:MAG: PQQ-dependent sugar dehydrogenase [Woeseiaceae bacterium]|nr:PQQ-dependent sugar dehydrogenase [Woeseiaceae bacterium]